MEREMEMSVGISSKYKFEMFKIVKSLRMTNVIEKYIANPQRRFQQQTSSKSTQQIPLKFVDNHFRQKIEISVLTQSAHIIKADGT